jgi:uncharacterized protein (TIGR00251 family)
MVDDLFDIVSEGDDESPPEIVLRLQVQPGAGRTTVVGRHGNALKVKVAAAPSGGRANSACLLLVAETFDIPRSQVELSAGEASRTKRVRIKGVAIEDVRRALELALGNAATAPGVGPQAR